MDAKEIVSRDPEVMDGELVFSGTRVAVERFVDYLKSGRSIEEFLREFQSVDREQVEAYLDLAAGMAAEASTVDAEGVAEGVAGDERRDERRDKRRTQKILEDLTEAELASLRDHQDLTPSKKGSGLSDISRDHDRYLAEGRPEGREGRSENRTEG